MTKTKNKVGRPTVMTDLIVQKLEDAFLKGYSDVQACIYAGISKQSLYNYCNENKEFLDQKELLKSNVSMISKTNIVDKIKEGDIELSKWWLERKNKNEFSLKTINDNTNRNYDKVEVDPVQERIKEIEAEWKKEIEGECEKEKEIENNKQN
jgi:hypothetical protein